MEVGHQIIHHSEYISRGDIDGGRKRYTQRLSFLRRQESRNIMYPVLLLYILCQSIPVFASIRIKCISYILIERNPEIWE
jgi:hypothetical protein